jgi:hypothetical protein
MKQFKVEDVRYNNARTLEDLIRRATGQGWIFAGLDIYSKPDEIMQDIETRAVVVFFKGD